MSNDFSGTFGFRARPVPDGVVHQMDTLASCQNLLRSNRRQTLGEMILRVKPSRTREKNKNEFRTPCHTSFNAILMTPSRGKQINEIETQCDGNCGGQQASLARTLLVLALGHIHLRIIDQISLSRWQAQLRTRLLLDLEEISAQAAQTLQETLIRIVGVLRWA